MGATKTVVAYVCVYGVVILVLMEFPSVTGAQLPFSTAFFDEVP